MTHISTSPPRVNHPRPVATPCHPSVVQPGVPQIELAARGTRWLSRACTARRSSGPEHLRHAVQRHGSFFTGGLLFYACRTTTRQGLSLTCVRAALCDICGGRTSSILAATTQMQPQDAARAICCVRGNYCIRYGKEDEHEGMDGGLRNVRGLRSAGPSHESFAPTPPLHRTTRNSVSTSEYVLPLFYIPSPHPKNNARRTRTPFLPHVSASQNPASLASLRGPGREFTPGHVTTASSTPAQPTPAHSLSPEREFTPRCQACPLDHRRPNQTVAPTRTPSRLPLRSFMLELKATSPRPVQCSIASSTQTIPIPHKLNPNLGKGPLSLPAILLRVEKANPACPASAPGRGARVRPLPLTFTFAFSSLPAGPDTSGSREGPVLVIGACGW
ncbi:hypothetical protein DPSP01_000754 [Paraphaeosphaeria sporulosa]